MPDGLFIQQQLDCETTMIKILLYYSNIITYVYDNTNARARPLFVQRERVDSCRRVRVRMIAM